MADLKVKELLVLARREPEDMGRYVKDGYVLRLVQYSGISKKGKPWSSVKLEHKPLKSESGEVKMSYTQGLTLEDLRTLKEQWEKVVGIMEDPPEPDHDPEPQAPPDDLEEVPF